MFTAMFSGSRVTGVNLDVNAERDVGLKKGEMSQWQRRMSTTSSEGDGTEMAHSPHEDIRHQKHTQILEITVVKRTHFVTQCDTSLKRQLTKRFYSPRQDDRGHQKRLRTYFFTVTKSVLATSHDNKSHWKRRLSTTSSEEVMLKGDNSWNERDHQK